MAKVAKQPPHYLVDFASRYAGQRFKTLNAFSAIYRAELLSWDIQSLSDLRKEAEDASIHFGFTHSTFEVISYYSVGMCTCLEWHARSRLADLTTFKPDVIEKADLSNIAGAALTQMVAEGVTVPHLLGAATKVSSVGEYIAIFKRLFTALDIKFDIEKELRGNKGSKLHDLQHRNVSSLYDLVESVFESRNSLVHEINGAYIGHENIRDAWSLDEAALYVVNVIECMRLIETKITAEGPQDFPNRLTKDGADEDQRPKLENKISELEKQIEGALPEEDDTRAAWIDILNTQRAAFALEMQFLADAEVLRPVRYYDVRELMQLELLKSRLAFLVSLKSEIDSV
jgi:hypothetical protein